MHCCTVGRPARLGTYYIQVLYIIYNIPTHCTAHVQTVAICDHLTY